MVRDESNFELAQDDNSGEKLLLWWIPAVYERFNFKVPDAERFQRAVRFPVDSTIYNPREHIAIYCFEAKETIVYPAAELPSHLFYQLTNTDSDDSELPVYRCERVKQTIQSSDGSSLTSDFGLSDLILFKKFKFEVVEVVEEKLIVEVSNYDDSTRSSMSNEEILLVLEPAQTEKEEPQQPPDDDKIELKDFDDEPNINDAEIAVQGFKPQDDNRLCPFYDPKIGGCFKLGGCRMIHAAKIEDGSFPDVQKVFFDNIPKQLPLPTIFTRVKIEITEFLDVNRFYCRYTNLKSVANEVDTATLVHEMNEKNVVVTYTPVAFRASLKQLVVVKMNDKKFFRGRVEDFIGSEADSLKVLLVDLGVVMTVDPKSIYNWCSFYNDVHFRAFEMTIGNIAPISKSLTNAGIRHVKQLMGRGVYADIFNNIGGIQCRLMIDDDDIGEELVGLGFAKLKKMMPPVSVRDDFLPG